MDAEGEIAATPSVARSSSSAVSDKPLFSTVPGAAILMVPAPSPSN